jgi:hypothetical protein
MFQNKVVQLRTRRHQKEDKEVARNKIAKIVGSRERLETFHSLASNLKL